MFCGQLLTNQVRLSLRKRSDGHFFEHRHPLIMRLHKALLHNASVIHPKLGILEAFMVYRWK